ncbi:MAG: YchF family ATPase [Candidatus Cloacimonetes bacterium]|nr:YchF family ATPase [Candidatus Cloacimonadota bacterium]
MKIGLIGLQNSGKTTIFNALTGQNVEITSYSTQKVEPNLGIVKVEDERITTLSTMYNPKKTMYATIEYIDFVGLTGNKESSDAFGGSAMGLVKTADALALVIRNYEDPMSGDEPMPIQEADSIESELIISDLIIAEKRLEKIASAKDRGIKDADMVIEEKALEKITAHLNEDNPLRTLELTVEEEKAVRGFQFISQKPLMVILNSDEDRFGSSDDILQKLEENYKAIEFSGNFEMELNNLEEEEATEFMQDMGITKSARDRLTAFSYELLGFISFFTVGTDEVRAWTITCGDDAVEAAGKIHSDLARGFIRAECFSYGDLIKHGDEKTIRENGLFRLEGKKYIVQDGDILNIRFSV